jgi:hypothetical protein
MEQDNTAQIIAVGLLLVMAIICVLLIYIDMPKLDD